MNLTRIFNICFLLFFIITTFLLFYHRESREYSTLQYYNRIEEIKTIETTRIKNTNGEFNKEIVLFAKVLENLEFIDITDQNTSNIVNNYKIKIEILKRCYSVWLPYLESAELDQKIGKTLFFNTTY